MTVKQRRLERKLLKELGILRRKRERLIDQVEGLKAYKEILRKSPKQKIPTQRPSNPETSSSISILS